jgi:hypothetical protein
MLKIRLSAVRSRQIELAAMLPELPTPRLLGLMGYINNIVGCILIHYEAVEKMEGRYQINQMMIEAIAQLSCNNALSITIPITYTHQYLHEYWPLATNHRPFIRDMRAVLSEMGLFTYKPMQPREGATRQDDGSCKSPASEYHDIDFCSLVALYELLEQMFLSRENPIPNEYGAFEDYQIEDLPPHRGALMREIFNVVFTANYRRVDELQEFSYVVEVELMFFMQHCPDNFQALIEGQQQHKMREPFAPVRH